jgi:hypothetical protein
MYVTVTWMSVRSRECHDINSTCLVIVILRS